MTFGRALSIVFAVGVVSAAAVGSRWRAPAPTPVPTLSKEETVELARLRGLVELLPKLRPGVDPTFGPIVASSARYHLIAPDRSFRDDCSGFVSAVFTDVGVPMNGVVASLYDQAVVHNALHWEPVPLVGDLVFFDNTTDRNHNHKWDDPQTHIGIIVAVEPDGTALFAHAGTSSGRKLGRINVAQAGRARDDDGNTLNSYLRSPSPGDPPTAGYLAGELWSGFSTIDPDKDWLTPPPPPETWP